MQIQPILEWFGAPDIGLPAIFIASFISATLLPVGSEPVLFAYISINPHLYWAAIAVATIGNTLGGMTDWWLGWLSRNSFEALQGPFNSRLQRWFEKLGPKVLLFAWLPGVGDPLCAVAGWLRLAWRPCFMYILIGKFARYLVLTWLLNFIPLSFWQDLGQWLHIH
jgi:membrane protein YqaA with SNARE-associated domain